jgi:hypothetical protein
MIHSCQFLCSELVTVTFEQEPGEIRQTVANLEEISTDSAVVLLDEKPNLGASISLSVKGRDLFGTVKGCLFDAALGWFAIVALESRMVFSQTPARDVCLLLGRCYRD